MKKISKVLCLVLALALAVMSVSITAVADVSHDGSSSITISGVPTSTTDYFKVYQIFSGDTSDDNDGVLSNIEWGSSLTDAGKAALISAINDYVGTDVLDSDAEAKDVAAALSTYVASDTDLRTIMMGIFNTSSNIVSGQQTTGISGISWTITGPDGDGLYTYSADIDDGYYFIVGVDANVTQDTIVVAVVGDTKVSEKTVDAVTIEKDVDNDNYSYAEGEDVTFNVTVTLPSTLSAYSSYTIKITDTLTGLSFDTSNTITAELIAPGQSSGANLSSITGSVDANVLTFSTTLDSSAYDFASYAGGKVVFTYTATVTDDGYKTSYNTAMATYSSDPTNSSVTTDTDETDPVQLYTVSIKVNKVDADNDALDGAFFTLEDADGNTVSTLDEYGVEITAAGTATSFYFVNLGEGTYTLSETTTPSGYNTTDDYTIKVNKDGTVTVTDADGGTTDYSVSVLENASTAGQVEFNVVNYTGSTLPETGGMGTKIFYTLGGILVVGAGILLIVKRRMRTA